MEADFIKQPLHKLNESLYARIKGYFNHPPILQRVLYNLKGYIHQLIELFLPMLKSTTMLLALIQQPVLAVFKAFSNVKSAITGLVVGGFLYNFYNKKDSSFDKDALEVLSTLDHIVNANLLIAVPSMLFALATFSAKAVANTLFKPAIVNPIFLIPIAALNVLRRPVDSVLNRIYLKYKRVRTFGGNRNTELEDTIESVGNGVADIASDLNHSDAFKIAGAVAAPVLGAYFLPSYVAATFLGQACLMYGGEKLGEKAYKAAEDYKNKPSIS